MEISRHHYFTVYFATDLNSATCNEMNAVKNNDWITKQLNCWRCSGGPLRRMKKSDDRFFPLRDINVLDPSRLNLHLLNIAHKRFDVFRKHKWPRQVRANIGYQLMAHFKHPSSMEHVIVSAQRYVRRQWEVRIFQVREPTPRRCVKDSTDLNSKMITFKHWWRWQHKRNKGSRIERDWA